MRNIPSIVLVLFVALLSACSFGQDKRYLNTGTAESLELPPDLTEFDVRSKFDLPTVFSGDDESVRDRVPVLAKVDSLKLRGSGNLYWLEVEEPVDNLYQMVKSFWAFEGYRLILDEPVIGVMQTEWIYKSEGGNQGGESWFESLFSSDDLSATQDQFKTRIERAEVDPVNRIYIAHRGTEYVHILEFGKDYLKDNQNVVAEEDTDNDWGFRAPEPELEVEMLSRLMIYLGLQEAEVMQQVADVKMFSPRASLRMDAEEKSPFLILHDPYQIAWNRVLHQLERMNFEIQSTDFNTGLFSKSFIVVNTTVKQGDSDNGGGWFSSEAESEVRTIALVVLEETHELTRVNIETISGEFDTSAAGADFLDLLYRQIK
ncbi:MAG: outer membrane protein assembly factor BamC [Gammaproteobacteria bacterium]|nr:outer membrane protein assembly factor BamC [Gammaproteobacteria bacterium]